MARQPNKKPQSEAARLSGLLKDYWLVTDQSPMNDIVHRVLKASIHKVPLRFFYQSPKAFDIEPVLQAIATKPPYERVAFDTASQEAPPLGAVEIPGLAVRFADFELLLPFYFERARRTYSSLKQSRSLEIELPFLLLVQHLLQYDQDSLDAIIEDAFTNADTGVIYAAPGGQYYQGETLEASFYERVRSLRPLAAMYLGLSEDILIGRDSDVNDCWINRVELEARNREYSLAHHAKRGFAVEHDGHFYDPGDATEKHKYPPDAPIVRVERLRYPELKRSICCDVESIGIIAHNFQVLQNPPAMEACLQDLDPQKLHSTSVQVDPEIVEMYLRWKPNYDRVHEVLESRLRGEDEEQIRKRIGFESRNKYLAWVTDNKISLTSRLSNLIPTEVFERWSRARYELGLQVNRTGLTATSAETASRTIVDFSAKQNLGNEDGLAQPAATATGDSAPAVDHIIISTDGSSITKNKRLHLLKGLAQREVLRILVQEFPNAVKWSYIQTHLTNDLGIPDSTYSTVKKIFKNNEATFKDLVENKERGFYRLNASQSADIENRTMKAEE